MPFVFWNVSDVTVSNFHIKDPQLWSLNIMNGTNTRFENIKANATATKAPYGKNWVQNTDGFDTMDAHNVSLTNFWYQGGDDCIAIKPRSYGITARNVTCHGGNGIAIGSLGQYLEDSSVENVLVDDVDIIRYNEDMHNSAYIKTWVCGSADSRAEHALIVVIDYRSELWSHRTLTNQHISHAATAGEMFRILLSPIFGSKAPIPRRLLHKIMAIMAALVGPARCLSRMLSSSISADG